VLAWLREKVHRHGRLMAADDINQESMRQRPGPGSVYKIPERQVLKKYTKLKKRNTEMKKHSLKGMVAAGLTSWRLHMDARTDN